MNSIERFLYKYRIVNLSEKKLDRWNRLGTVGKLIFAAQNGTFDIRLKCINYLNERTSEPKVKELLISLVSDEVEIVAEEAIKTLEPTATSELQRTIEQIRENWKAKKRIEKQQKSYVMNVQFGDSGKTKPSDRLTQTLRNQQQANHPPFGF